MTQRIFAPAKLNLCLRVIGRRADGYHTLNSLIAFTDFGDTLTLEAAKSFAFRVDGLFAAQVPADGENLAVRAVRAMEKAAGRRANMAVTLTKMVPAGAGLGGGSADAAAIMHALNDAWGGPLTLPELQALGLSLGAELPICLAATPHRVEGIGERLTPVDVPPMHAVVVWPGVPCRTADVFKNYRGPFSKAPVGMTDSGNDLTDAAAALVPAIKTALKILPGARMTGSGSAVFSVCDNETVAKETAARLAAAYPQWWVRACTINPSPRPDRPA